MTLYTRGIRPLLFRVDAERMHNAGILTLRQMGKVAPLRERIRRRYRVLDKRLNGRVCGLEFENPIGLAAGYDKNGAALPGLAALGFGFLEIGSVSADPSPGNPRPRLFRLPQHEAIIVHYGLPNWGAERIVDHLKQVSCPVPVGINLVNTNRLRLETEDEIVEDFVRAVRMARNVTDYITLNLSCPNTEAGRSCFQDHRHVTRLLDRLKSEAIDQPLFLKVSPLGGVPAIESLLEAVDGYDFVSGFIFNTPGHKPDELELSEEQKERMPGAVTGPVHQAMMNKAIKSLYQRMDREHYRIIGVGGVFTAEDAYQKIRLGASLVQLYTALIYRGPGVVRAMNEGLIELLDRDGLSTIQDAVGVDVT